MSEGVAVNRSAVSEWLFIGVAQRSGRGSNHVGWSAACTRILSHAYSPSAEIVLVKLSNWWNGRDTLGVAVPRLRGLKASQ
jgi:hypothetical protein